jgi:hypothetical protein
MSKLKAIAGLPMSLLAAAVAGCSGTSLPEALSSASITAASNERAEPPIEIYSRIARGANTCWFGANGSLRKTHIFHADVAPTVDTTGAEITIHERDARAENPRSVRAFRIGIASTGGGSAVTPENFRFPADVSVVLFADVARWSSGDTSCGVMGVGGWNAAPAKAAEAAEAAKPKQPPEKKKGR